MDKKDISYRKVIRTLRKREDERFLLHPFDKRAVARIQNDPDFARALYEEGNRAIEQAEELAAALREIVDIAEEYCDDEFMADRVDTAKAALEKYEGAK